jgi:hypothetical protein
MTDFDAETMLGEPTREPQLMKNISTLISVYDEEGSLIELKAQK